MNYADKMHMLATIRKECGLDKPGDEYDITPYRGKKDYERETWIGNGNNFHRKKKIKRLEKNPMRPGEMPLKAWLLAEGERRGKKLSAMYNDFYNGLVKTPPMRRINQRVIFVRVNL